MPTLVDDDHVMWESVAINRYLEATGQMVGNTFTLADLHVASVARLLPGLDVDLGPHEHLSAWLTKTLARPARARVAAMG